MPFRKVNKSLMFIHPGILSCLSPKNDCLICKYSFFSYVPLKRKKIKSKSSVNPRNSKPTQKKTPNPKKSAKKTPVPQKNNNFTSQSRLTQTSPIKPVTNPRTPTKQLSMDLFTNRKTKPGSSNTKGILNALKYHDKYE